MAKKMDWRYNTIWFDQVDADKVATISSKEPLPLNFKELDANPYGYPNSFG